MTRILSKPEQRGCAASGEYLARVLAGDKVDYLYAADARRAQQTAAPIANEFKLPVNLLASSDWAGFASRIKREHRGKVVVVVGYANTIPVVLGELSASSVAIAEDDYDSIFLSSCPVPDRRGPSAFSTGQRWRSAVKGR